ncbi:thioredoxin [Marinicauda sp. Alg238-R41]|uniref:thioredoxin n=1 Tax=Marinicauda sp. Alg238-R41 TaxID=2993447 RepID=UPI0022E3395D|nr:thioredoxin [Marinicauda sp. Alg238-R41]
MSILGPNGEPQPVPSSTGEDAAPAAASAASLISETTDQNFVQDVVEPSKEVPVLVDFWAPWCGPCRQLGPMLEAAVTKANGAVRLVKINIDENPGIAGQLRIQSIPAVIAFQNGQPVDGFMGALPESQIRDFIARLSGDVNGEEVEQLLERAEAALGQGDLGGAAQDFAAALQMDGDNMTAVAGLARVHLASGDSDQAQAILDQVPEPKKSDPAIASVRAAMELAGESGDAGDLSALQERVTNEPDSAKAHFELGRALIGSGDLDRAARHLLDSIERDREHADGAARQLLLKIFDAAGPTSDVAKSGRRRLSSILFS